MEDEEEEEGRGRRGKVGSIFFNQEPQDTNISLGISEQNVVSNNAVPFMEYCCMQYYTNM